jgi:tRNA(Ile)-lysidine synthetase-like protein
MSMAKTQSALYVVAVSGGVDSVALLHILHGMPGVQLIVAHFDHGIREDSAADREFVEYLAKLYDVAFAYDEGHLGAGASEAAARDARYTFLRRVKDASGAQAIVTAHHEDDVFETAIINLLRGTGRKGLSSLGSTDELYRPLLQTPKKNLLAYAKNHNLQWREDSTNLSDDYLRNYVRHNILTKFDDTARTHLRKLIESTRETNVHIDQMLAEQLHLQPSFDVLDRHWFIMLPHVVAREIVAAWLRGRGVADFDKTLVERVVVAAKMYAPGKQIDVSGNYVILVRKDDLALVRRDR